MKYRMNESNPDADLDENIAVERVLHMRTCHSGEVVTSIEDFIGRYPDARERDMEVTRRLFVMFPSLYLRIIPIVG